MSNLIQEILEESQQLSLEERKFLRIFLLKKGEVDLARKVYPFEIPEVSL